MDSLGNGTFESVFLNTRLGSLVNPQAEMPALRP